MPLTLRQLLSRLDSNLLDAIRETESHTNMPAELTIYYSNSDPTSRDPPITVIYLPVPDANYYMTAYLPEVSRQDLLEATVDLNSFRSSGDFTTDQQIAEAILAARNTT